MPPVLNKLGEVIRITEKVIVESIIMDLPFVQYRWILNQMGLTYLSAQALNPLTRTCLYQ